MERTAGSTLFTGCWRLINWSRVPGKYTRTPECRSQATPLQMVILLLRIAFITLQEIVFHCFALNEPENREGLRSITSLGKG